MYLGTSTLGITNSKLVFSDSYGQIAMGGHILPDSNAAYDLGSAEYKVRHLFLSDNSLWVGDNHKIDTSGGSHKTRKRKKNGVPKSVTDEGGNEAGALTHSGKPSLSEINLSEWVAYLKSLNPAKDDVSDLYPPEKLPDGDPNPSYTNDDYDEVIGQEAPGKHPAPIASGVDNINAELFLTQSFVVVDPTGDFTVNCVGATPTEGNHIDITIYVKQGGYPYNIASLNIDGVPASQLRITGQTPIANEVNTFDVKAVFLGGSWKATVIVG